MIKLSDVYLSILARKVFKYFLISSMHRVGWAVANKETPPIFLRMYVSQNPGTKDNRLMYFC